MTKLIRTIYVLLMVATLSSCGGGGGSAGTTTFGSTGTATGTTGTTGTSNTIPVLTSSLVDANGNNINSISGGDIATVNVKFVTSTGAPIPNAVVTVTGDATLVQITPSTALTDATGVASVKIKPASFTAAGALTLSIQAVSGTLTAIPATPLSLSVGQGSLVIGALSISPAQTGSLPAFSAVTVSIPVTSNGQAVTTITGLNLTSKCVGDGTATLVQGASTAPGVFSATYTNNGCTRGTDQITASINNSTQSISLNVSSANIGSIQFVGTDSPTNSIVLKGSGGIGRNESAIVTFKIVDQNKVGLAGVVVNFAATTNTGSLTVLPATATSDANGNVSTTVSSGTIPTPVRVVATATRNGSVISGLSDSLTISTGLPIQKSMSLSVDVFNPEGLNYDGTIVNATIRLADQYGNPVSDNTAVNFVTEGGAIASSSQGGCNTLNGACTVQLKTQAFRPANGRVTIMAYAQGLKTFTDLNGDGQYSCANPVDVNGNPVTQSAYRPLVDKCPSGGEPYELLGDAFLDAGSLSGTTGFSTAGTLDGQYDPANGDLPFPYGHAAYTSADSGQWGITYIRRSLEVTFSGSTPFLVRMVCGSTGCRDWITATDGDPTVIQGLAASGTGKVSGVDCSSRTLTFRIADVNNNPMPVATSVGTSDSLNIAPGTMYPAAVVSTNNIGGTQHSVTINPEATCKSGNFNVSILTPKGNGGVFSFRSN